MLEKTIELQILSYLKLKGIFCWKNHTTGFYDPSKKCFRRQASPYAINGVADILGVYKGKLIAIEVKSLKGKVSDAQQHFLNNVIANGGVGIVARCLEDVTTMLESLDSSRSR